MLVKAVPGNGVYSKFIRSPFHMLVGIWLGLYWVLFYFFDIISPFHYSKFTIWTVLYWVLSSFFDHYTQSSVHRA